MKRVLTRILVALLVLVVLGGAAGAYTLKSYIPNTAAQKSFPQVEGELQVPGLDGTVDVYRDEMGIPHIYADTIHDLFFAQGYVHAQERFWQMDFWRHMGSARLSEMFGASQVGTDSFLRTLGWRQTAEAEYAMLGEQSRAILDAYADGVNAYIGDRQPVELSLEYLILTNVLNRGYEIEPWTPTQSLTWGKAMAWDLRGNMDNEIERAILLKTLSLEQVNELYPPYPQDHPVIVPEIGGQPVGLASEAEIPLNAVLPQIAMQNVADNFASLEAVTGKAGDGIGSNSWAVSGDLTGTGMPLLANDPHLGIQMPSIWYQVGLHCREKTEACPFEVGGFSFAGVPGVIIGHTDSIAWGLTNTGPDVMDLYIEKVNPDNPNQYEVNGAWVDFETRQETIQVAGGDPVTLTVRISRHGPVVSDTYGALMDEVDLEKNPDAVPFKDRSGVDLPENYVIALAWTALTPSTPFEAIWGFNTAQNWDDFRTAASKFHVPAQNLMYADTAGNIGYQMPGDIPLRASGDGRLPVPGWTDDYEWTGYVPFEELPYTLNPESGYIVAANNQVPPWDYPYMITTDWDYGFRANRIAEMIQSAPGKIDIPYIQSMQGDTLNPAAQTFVPLLKELTLDPEAADVLDHFLLNWDLRDEADSQAALVFEWFWWNLLMNTFADDLPDDFLPEGGARWMEVMRNLVDQPESAWWDNQLTPDTVETRDDVLLRTFADTATQMRREYDEDLTQWPTWGEVHSANFRNATLGESGIGPIEELFNRGPFATGGGSSIVNATSWNVGESMEVSWLPSMRMIVDLGDLQNSLTMHTTGQSGHAFHPQYINLAPLWANVDYYPMHWDAGVITAEAASHLRLVP
ncbi:MAG: penicillin acylase family protein [Anaerolineales bacterium]